MAAFAGDAHQPRADVGVERSPNKSEQRGDPPGKFRSQNPDQHDIGRRRRAPNQQRHPNGNVAAVRIGNIAPALLAPQNLVLIQVLVGAFGGAAQIVFALFALAVGRAQGRSQAQQKNHHRRTDRETEPEVQAVGDARGQHRHAGGPAVQNAIMIQDRIGAKHHQHVGDEGSHDNAPWQDESREDDRQVRADRQRRRGEHIADIARQIDERNRQQLDRGCHEDAGDRRHDDIDQAEEQADDGAGGKNAPAPAFLLRAGFGQRGRSADPDRGHGERQAFDVAGHAEQRIAQRGVQDAVKNDMAGEYQDRLDPERMKEAARLEGRLALFGQRTWDKPGWDIKRQVLGLRRLHQVLVPNQSAERPAEQMHAGAQFAAHHHERAADPI